MLLEQCNAMGCFHPLLFCCFFRSGEITLATEQSFEEDAHLTFYDVSVDHLEDPKVLKVKLKVTHLGRELTFSLAEPTTGYVQ